MEIVLQIALIAFIMLPIYLLCQLRWHNQRWRKTQLENMRRKRMIQKRILTEEGRIQWS